MSVERFALPASQEAALSDANAQDRSDPIPLVVDLDGTLCRTDTLHEALIALVAQSPVKLFALPGWVAAGKADFKSEVASRMIVDAATLPYRSEVLELVREARAANRRTILVSASDHRQVEAVAAHLGLFDEAFGTGGPGTGNVNLGGWAKAAFLTERFGTGGFDYVGDAPVDRPVWAAARQAITVGADGALRGVAEGANSDARHIAPAATGAARLRPYLKALRPHQWSKNMLVFLPLLSAHDFSSLGAALAAFVAFCLTASSVYVINDLVDLHADRAHPRKCRRPFAAGDIPIREGVAMATGLILGALALTLAFTPLIFLATLGVYYATTFAYSLWLKRKLVVDVLTLAGLYTIRIIGGGAAAGLALSPWMLGFSLFVFLSLAAVKRQAELTDLLQSGRNKSPGRGYEPEDLPVLRGTAISAAHAAVLVFALYINSAQVVDLYQRPEILWLVCPLLIYWMLRMIMMTHRGNMTDDPIVYAATDRVSQIVIVMGAATFVLAGIL